MVRHLAGAVLCSMALTAHAATALFDFDGPDSPLFTATDSANHNLPPFALTRSGLTATFLAPWPGEFQVDRSSWVSLTGNVLMSPRPKAVPLVLTIDFSAPQTSVDLLFGLFHASDVLHMALYDAGTLIGSTSASGTPEGLFDFAGELSFSGEAFDRIVLAAGGMTAFAIDDLRLQPAAIPEPEIVWLLGAGLLGVMGIAGRRAMLARTPTLQGAPATRPATA